MPGIQEVLNIVASVRCYCLGPVLGVQRGYTQSLLSRSSQTSDYIPMSRLLPGGGRPREYGSPTGIDPLEQDWSKDTVNPRAPGVGG